MSGSRLLANAVLALALARELRNLVQVRTFGQAVHTCGAKSRSTVEVLIPASGESEAAVTEARARFAQFNKPFHLLGTQGEPAEKQALLNNAIAASDRCVTHFLIYDVDSSPSGLPEVLDCQVAQQLAVYVTPANMDTRGFWQGMADNQTLWAAGYESRSLDRGSTYYLVGHGLTVSRVVIEEQGGFRTGLPGEDIYLGYSLALRRIRPCRLEGRDVCDAPAGWRRMLLQSERWFIGEATALRDAARGQPGAGPLILKRGAGLLHWATGPWVLLTALWASSAPVSLAIVMLLVRRAAWAQVARLGSRGPASSRRRRMDTELRFLGFLVKPAASSVVSLIAVSRLVWHRGELTHIERERRVADRTSGCP